ncbi:1-deoxy-D-xylulose-5-phosphate synthase, partial [Listeria monocytogenes]
MFVVIGFVRAGLDGAVGDSLEGIFDISFLNCIPIMSISMTFVEVDASHLMVTAFSYIVGPFAFRYPRGDA